ncbi:MAG TPA: glycosyltransferase family 2 protein [Patescibacteria group bacterium]|jgi:glycosyltransferase involved in cell wall biosynthesis|nr:glycosyltransferase family 2 protein [Patescibacteria group bacterium]
MSQATRKTITVIIPCYNEATAIDNVIKKFPHEKLELLGYTLDVLVVDNNSSDNTAEIARSAGARVIFEPKPGKGNAIRAGFCNISDDANYVAMIDGDDTYCPQELLRLIEPIDSGFSQVITGSRMHGRIKAGSMKKFNHFGNRVYSQLVRSGYRVPVTDVLTGYCAWSRDVIENLLPHLSEEGFSIEMEMITKLVRLGYEIYCVPISYEARIGDSSLRPFRDGSRILKTYLKNLRWRPVIEMTKA